MIKITPLKDKKGTYIKGPLIIEPEIINDKRGFFYESWNQSDFNESVGEKVTFVQDNHSLSILGTLRGLHYQKHPSSQGKLVRATKGEIFDVFVDLRVKSETYSSWAGIKITERNFKQIWIPSGFAHGFLTLTEVAEVQYKTTTFWHKEVERSINWDDSKIGIEWPLYEISAKEPLLSLKDLEAPSLNEARISGDLFL